MKPPLRTKSVSTKVSEEEFVALESRARARKLTLSEWVRAELLEPRGGEMGRFMSPDPSGLLAQRPADPQSWNLYAYARNNPMIFIDPNGLDCIYATDNGKGVFSLAKGVYPNPGSISCPNDS